MERSKNKVVLGLSGGVDSTVAAMRLKENGFEVTGYYFDISGNNEKGRREAEAAAEQLDIPFIAEDVSARFKEYVTDNFCREYMSGRTPNPCIVCNPNVKFHQLIETADRTGAYYVATGHYAGICFDEDNDRYYIRKAANGEKDQSYMLYRLEQKVLRRLIFPLERVLDKSEVRSTARDSNLSNAEKRDSQEICFVPEGNYVSYMESQGYSAPEGDFVDKDGNVLGRHRGITHYTLGQRKGLGIALGRPAFVTGIDPAKNQVIIGENEDLFSRMVVSADNFFTAFDALRYDGTHVMAKVRYAARPAEAVIRVEKGGERIVTEFAEAQRAATPGQSIVFYDDEGRVIGGGFIEKM